uniref:RNA-dependent RNA polymerase n=3 Tax=unclassified Orthopicobirnavirus TaxID=2960910 RepID=A0A059U0E0_9VIRU|nr:RNA-dependent RNA polymerase [Picobirnavirus GI/PBV/turkey/USA/MN-1/2011]
MKSATKFSQYYDTSNPGLRAYFKLIEHGQPDIYRTTFAKGQDPQQVLAQWMGHLRPIKREWPTLYQFEVDLSKKVGPMSVMKPLAQRLTDIDSYYEGISLPSKPLRSDAVDAVIKEWRSIAGLRVRSQASTVQRMKLSTNSGSPYFTKRSAVINKTVPCAAWMDEYYCKQNLQGSTWGACATLGWRGQEGGPTADDVKQRVIWMFPLAVNIRELQMYQPLIEAAQRFNLVPAWVSMDAVDATITKMFDSKPKRDLVVCTDFTAFDQHINPKLQIVAESVLDALTTGPEAGAWLREVFPIKYNIPLAYDYGKIRFGPHGMASGSGGTNADETIMHRALQHEAAMMNGSELNPHSQCLGDDGLLTYPGITVEDVVEVYESHGLDMNTIKQYASTNDCEYLRRWHHVDYRMDGIMVGVYATSRALGRLLYTERYYSPEMWGPKAVALRQLSILENVKYHPMREEFTEFCMKRDKFRLGLDIPHFLDDIEQIAQEVTDYMPDFLGYVRSNMESVGISSWWIVNYLKSKA